MSYSRRSRWLAGAVGLIAVVAGVLFATAMRADAALLFADDFEQPTVNVWHTGGGGSWTVADDNGDQVFRQSSVDRDTVAWAGSGSGPFTVLRAQVKPLGDLGGPSAVALLAKFRDPNNYYYLALRGGTFEAGKRQNGIVTPIASVPFTAAPGTWYTLTFNLFFTGTVDGTVSGPGGTGARVQGPDPGSGAGFGSAVGFWTNQASAAFDDIRLDDDRVLPSSSPPPPSRACPVAITFLVPAQWTTGFVAQFNLTNITAATIPPGWTLSWTFTNGEVISSLWNATWSQVGANVVATSAAWAPPIPPGGTASVGFVGSGRAARPTNVRFNGIPCSVA